MRSILNRVVALLVLALVLSSCGTKTNQESNSTEDHFTFFEGKTMGTKYHIKVYDSIVPQQDQIDSVLALIDTALSTYNPHSYISRFNVGADSASLDSFQYEMKDMFNSVVNLSARIYRSSQGAFDPSAARLFNYWGFGENGPQRLTDTTELHLALASKGMSSVVPAVVGSKDGAPIILKKVSFNFNAIAKGYGVDELASFLSSLGCKNYMVEIGGEVYCAGTKPDGKPFSIGINTPKEGASTKSYTSIVDVSNAALATSGNYRNFYVKDGKKYSHTIDPRSGYPVENNVLSASILAPDCATADAWATACMVLGVDSSIHIINQIQDVDVYILYDVNGELKDTMTATFPRSE